MGCHACVWFLGPKAAEVRQCLNIAIRSGVFWGTEMVHEHEGLKVALCLEFLCLQHAAKSMTKIGEGASCITHHVISWAWERRKVIQVFLAHCSVKSRVAQAHLLK